MNTINIEATDSTPSVIYGDDGKLCIEGRSMPENVTEFYQPLIDWAVMLQVNALNVEINLDYLNSTSIKKMLNLLKVLDTNNNIKQLTIIWYYEEGDEDTLEHGQIFEELLLKASFRYHEYAEAA